MLDWLKARIFGDQPWVIPGDWTPDASGRTESRNTKRQIEERSEWVEGDRYHDLAVPDPSITREDVGEIRDKTRLRIQNSDATDRLEQETLDLLNKRGMG